MKVLVTGGAGYIGSTTAKALEEAGHTPVVLDPLMAPRAEESIDDAIRSALAWSEKRQEILGYE